MWVRVRVKCNTVVKTFWKICHEENNVINQFRLKDTLCVYVCVYVFVCVCVCVLC